MTTHKNYTHYSIVFNRIRHKDTYTYNLKYIKKHHFNIYISTTYIYIYINMYIGGLIGSAEELPHDGSAVALNIEMNKETEAAAIAEVSGGGAKAAAATNNSSSSGSKKKKSVSVPAKKKKGGKWEKGVGVLREREPLRKKIGGGIRILLLEKEERRIILQYRMKNTPIQLFQAPSVGWMN
jgi:hypothetical protein